MTRNRITQTNLQQAFEKAIARHNARAVRQLILRGADVNKPDAQGFSPLAQAVKWGPRDSALANEDIRNTARKRALQTVRTLLNAGADPTWRNTSAHAFAYSVSGIGLFFDFIEPGDKIDLTLKRAAQKKKHALSM